MSHKPSNRIAPQPVVAETSGQRANSGHLASPRHRFTRRQALSSAGLTTVTLAVAGCNAFSTDPKGSEGHSSGNGQSGPSSAAKEAPSLAAQVKSGDLPPLKDRLPDSPIVVQPVDQPGTYGGTWTLFGDNPPLGGGSEVSYDWLVRWNAEWSEVEPNLAESWDVEQAGRQYTFHLRKGVKWSDGKPFTADDVIFAYNDVYMNDKINPAGPPEDFKSRGEFATCDKVDDYTVRFSFSSPAGLFLEFLASNGATILTTCARHYFSQFHDKYNPDAGNLAKDAGFDTWAELFISKGGNGGSDLWQPSVPILTAWRTTAVQQAGSRLILKRNPFYWKTDPQGRQLPYIDTINRIVIKSKETALLKAEAGDFQFLHPTFYNPNLGTPDNKPVLARNRDKGQYHFVDGRISTMNRVVIALNLNCKNKALRDIFQKRDFRIGLSYAINRPEIIDAVYQRQGEPWQAAPRKESEFYVEELAKQYTEYDVEKANQHLDKAGYSQRDSAGFRQRPDGQRISFNMEVITQEPTEISCMELVKKYWQEVGVEMNLKTVDRSLFYERKEANQHEANVWTGDGGLRSAVVDPRWYFPVNNESNFALRWSMWYRSDGTDGEKPPEAPLEQMRLYDQIKASTDVGKRKDLFMQILQIAVEQFWAIGTVLPLGAFGIATNDFHNLPQQMIASWRYPTPGPTHPEQYFLSQG